MTDSPDDDRPDDEMSGRILIIEARFYTDIADMLLEGARRVIEERPVAFDMVTVPGALEIPTALHYAVRGAVSGRSNPHYDGYVVLGCVIRGETSHYDLVCRECSHGVMTLSADHFLALGFGVLTVENKGQALARADCERGDQGGRAARACLSMMDLKHRFSVCRE